MQDEDGYITLNPKPWKPVPTPAAEPALSSWWRVVAFALLLVSVGLLVGLVALGLVLVTQQNHLQAENARMSDSVQRLARGFCQALIKQLEQKQKGSYEHPCSPCDPQWRYFGDSCYGFFRRNLTWGESRRYCAGANATLTKAASRDVQEYLKARTVLARWLGLSQRDADDTWRWEDGSALPLSMLDLSGDGTEPAKCAYFHHGKIRPAPCADRHYFMCERRAGPARAGSLLP